MATITKSGPQGELPIKRFYLSGVILKAKCPKCGRQCVLDFDDQYLSYPPTNKAFSKTLYCEEEYHADGTAKCGHQFEVELVLNVSLDIAKK